MYTCMYEEKLEMGVGTCDRTENRKKIAQAKEKFVYIYIYIVDSGKLEEETTVVETDR